MKSGQDKKMNKIKKIVSILSIVITIMMIPILVINGTMLYKSVVNPSEPVDFMGYMPLVMKSVETEEAISLFEDNALVIFKKTAPDKEHKIGEIVCYWKDKDIISQKLRDIQKDEAGNLIHIVGNADNDDNNFRLLDEELIFGEYVTHINDVGSIVLYMSTPAGMVTCVAIPIVLIFLAFHISDKRKYKKQLEEALAASKESFNNDKEEAQNEDSEIKENLEEKIEENNDENDSNL